MSVHPQIEERRYTIKVDIYFTSFPSGRNSKSATVRAYFIPMLVSNPILGRSTHHTTFPVAYFHLMLENNWLIGINGNTIFQGTVFLNTCNIPLHRNCNIIPCRYIIGRLIKIGRTFFRVSNPIKLPGTIQ